MRWLKNIVALKINHLVLWLAWALVAFYCSSATAWSKRGHAWLTEETFLSLPEKQQMFYLSLGEQLANNKFFKKQIDKRQSHELGADDAFFNSTVFPDTIRDLTLAEIFKSMDTVLPHELHVKHRDNTSTWHYINNVTQAESVRCGFDKTGELIEALTTLDKAIFRSKKNLEPSQLALIIGFQLHFLQDLHQPLHTFTKLDGKCHSDRGGNSTCVQEKDNGQCQLNLHRYWDAGLGLFWQKQIADLSLPDIVLPSTSAIFLPKDWAEQQLEYFDVVYDVNTDSVTRASADSVLYQQLALTIARSRFYLNRVYEEYGKDD